MQRILIAGAIFAVLCGSAAWFGSAGGAQGHWYGIVPPVLAIVLAFATRNVIYSLGLAIGVGAILRFVPAAPASPDAWGAGAKAIVVLVAGTATDMDNLLTLSFLPPIFAMVETIMAAGGFRGLVTWLLKRVRTGRSAQLATATLGTACFIDDYTSAIISGSMMQPITDRFRVSRAKLAFLVDATSAPIAGLAVISTWIAYETSLFAAVSTQLGLGKTGYAMFFDALSFRFYCLLMLAFVYLHILLGRDFGPMREAEEQTRRGDGDGDRGPPPVTRDPGHVGAAHASLVQGTGHSIAALLPIVGLLSFHLIGLWIDGGGPGKLTGAGLLLSPAYWRDVISAAPHCRQLLCLGALFGTALAVGCGRWYGSLAWSAVPGCLYRGLRRAVLPAVILILAWSLKSCCEHLGTGPFLTGMLADRIPPYCFPPLLFTVACVISFATGTSYGTMAILIPTAIPIAYALDGDSYGLITMISLGAVLDGAIFGDHCSPISDTTIFSATASSCDLVLHTRTQLPYSLFVAGVALTCAYAPSALGLRPLWGFGLSVLTIVVVLFALERKPKAMPEPLPN